MEKIGCYTKEYLEEVITVFQPDSPTVLTLDDAREIIDNLLNTYFCLAKTENININKIKAKSA